jgi:hypothetical protein
VYTTFGREKSLTHGSETIVRRKKHKKRRKATGELDDPPDALHLAHDPKRHRAFGREACTSTRGAARPARETDRHRYSAAAISRDVSGCDAPFAALALGAIPVRTAEADAHPLRRREYLTLKLPPLAMQIPLAVQMCITVPWRDPAY